VKRQRTVAIFAGHFPPSNLAGVHRARLFSQHLREFGWNPVIVTTHWRRYEEELDWDLLGLVDQDVEVIRTDALPTRPVRLVGDIGVRGLPWHLAALRKLRRERDVDFLLITVPSFYSALLGELLRRFERLPFGIDYIDPWVHSWPEAEVRFSKAWLSLKLAERLEPWAVRNASLITGVASGYYEGVLERNPHLRGSSVSAAMPYGFSSVDFAAPELQRRKPSLFDPQDGSIHLVYAGALLPKARSVLEAFLQGCAVLRQRRPQLAEKLRLHFIGTGTSPSNPAGFMVAPVAQRLGLGDMVSEHPHRMAYLDVLTHLVNAQGIFILGSTEPHYTPSKVYQSVQARRPVFALLHEASTAVDVLQRSGAGQVVPLQGVSLPAPQEIAAALESFVAFRYDPDRVDWSSFESFSARESSRRMAAALDEAMARTAHR
jgi:hypothetical protein